MATPIADASDIITATATTFPATPQWKYTVPAGKYLLLSEISFAVDGTFSSGKGKLLLKLRNQIITTGGVNQTAGGITLLANLSLDFKKQDVVAMLGTGEEIEFSARSTDGTSVQSAVALTGFLLDEGEAQNKMRVAKERGDLVFGTVF